MCLGYLGRRRRRMLKQMTINVNLLRHAEFILGPLPSARHTAAPRGRVFIYNVDSNSSRHLSALSNMNCSVVEINRQGNVDSILRPSPAGSLA